jgi:hypothetical protein
MLWVVFTRSESLISKIFRWDTKGCYNRVQLLWEDPLLGWLRLDSDKDGCHLRPTAVRPSLCAIKVLDKQLSKNLDSVAIPLHKNYRVLLPICMQWLTNGWHSRLVHQAIALGLKQLRHPGFGNVASDKITPQAFFEILKANRKVIWGLESAKGA